MLLDELAPLLVGHEVVTVQSRGWAGVKNGELLRQASAGGFEVFITSDQNLQFQQNLKGYPLSLWS